MKKNAVSFCLALLTYCFSIGYACAQNYLPPTVKDALQSAELSVSQMAASVRPLDGGALRLNWRDRVKVVPASTEKMVTTLAALELLGPNWRWKTSFYYDGNISAGELHGALFIKGGGDPKYVLENLWRDLSRLKSLGINRIDGDIVIDRSYFEKDYQDPEFQEDWDRPYTAPADAALLNYQSVSMTISPKKEEKIALLTATPQLQKLQLPASVSISDQKGCVEKSIDLLQKRYKPLLRGKGVIEDDAQERWATDYRTQAILDLDDFARVVIHSVLYLNSGRLIDGKTPAERWLEMSPRLMTVDMDELHIQTLPRDTAKLTRKGIRINRMWYAPDDATGLTIGDSYTIAYDPADLRRIHIILADQVCPCHTAGVDQLVSVNEVDATYEAAKPHAQGSCQEFFALWSVGPGVNEVSQQ